MTELHAAFVFDCEECGKENFIRALEGNMDESAIEEAAKSGDVTGFLVARDGKAVESPDGGDPVEYHAESLYQVIAVAPPFVTCKHCGHTSHTVAPDEHMEYDDDDTGN